jgi:hypothetical protein
LYINQTENFDINVSEEDLQKRYQAKKVEMEETQEFEESLKKIFTDPFSLATQKKKKVFSQRYL